MIRGINTLMFLYVGYYMLSLELLFRGYKLHSIEKVKEISNRFTLVTGSFLSMFIVNNASYIRVDFKYYVVFLTLTLGLFVAFYCGTKQVNKEVR